MVAARAIAVETALAGAASITIVNRGRERGTELVNLLNSKTSAKASLTLWSSTYTVPAGTDIVINATSIGLEDAEASLDIDLASLQPGMVVADVIANPPRTRLIRDAQARGCKTIDGLGMLVNQGVIGVKFWTGLDVDPAIMQAKLKEIFGA